MTALVLRRIALAIPLLAAVSLLMFIVLYIGPNPLEQLKQDPSYTAQDIARLTHLYGWDRPWYVQYATWATHFVRGDWGDSIVTKRPATEMIGERLPLTMVISLGSMILSILIAVPDVSAVHAAEAGDLNSTCPCSCQTKSFSR